MLVNNLTLIGVITSFKYRNIFKASYFLQHIIREISSLNSIKMTYCTPFYTLDIPISTPYRLTNG